MRPMPAMLVFVVLVGLGGGAARANSISIDLAPASDNPASPQMGDQLSFHSVIRNEDAAPVDGLIAWLSLVRIDKGNEQPVDLEDWSAHKAITANALASGRTLETDWPMRLIQDGIYRVVVSVVSRDGTGLTPSPFVDFSVRRRPVVESQRVLPVAFGLPLLLGGAMLWRSRRSRAPAAPAGASQR
jgi:hypothetical protein